MFRPGNLGHLGRLGLVAASRPGLVAQALAMSETLTFDILPADLATGTVALRDASTGALLGATMTMGQLFTGVASLIREKELAAEAAAQSPAEA